MTDAKDKLIARNHRLESLVRLGRVLADSRLDLDAKLQVCVDILAELAGAEKASLSLVEDGRLVVKAATNPHILGLSTRLQERTISTDVVRSGQPVYFADVADSEYAGKRREGDQSTYRTPSLIVLPLVDAGTVAGTLNLSDKRGASVFSPEDFALAREIADQVSSQIYFSAMHSRLSETFRDLDQAVRDKKHFGALVLSGLWDPLNQTREDLRSFRELHDLAQDEGGRDLARIQGTLELVLLRMANLSGLAALVDYAPTPAKIALSETVQRVRENLNGLIDGLRVKVWLEADSPAPIRADVKLVEDVLANLLCFVVEAASAERGGRGEVTVRVMIHDHRALIQFDVAGPDAVFALAKNALNGMNPLDPKQDQRNLTLVFSRRAARLLEGDITLLKLPGGGARFILSLPLQAVAIPKENF